jgi:hypothetical protein
LRRPKNKELPDEDDDDDDEDDDEDDAMVRELGQSRAMCPEPWHL